MRRTLGCLVAATCLLSACKVNVNQVGTTGKKPATSTVSAPATGVTSPSGGNVTSPSGGNVTSPSGGNVVSPGGANLKDLLGHVRIDATYVISAGGGNVISPGGGNVISPGGGNVISAGGGNLIQVGNEVISPGGGNVISPGGGNVISPGGGNVISPGGGNYRLLDIAVAFGDMLAVQGMVVVPVSLRTGKIIGEAVYTDATGGFKVKVPDTETGNVRLVAAIPVKSKDDPRLKDPRLHYEYLSATDSSQKDAAIDEDTALVHHYIRQSFAGRIFGLVTQRDRNTWGDEVNAWTKLGNNAIIQGVLDELYGEMRDANTPDMSYATRYKLAQDLADIVMYYTNMDEAIVDKNTAGWTATGDEKAVPALVDIVRQCREGARTKMKDKPDYFDRAQYVLKANGVRIRDNGTLPADQQLPTWKIVKPSELGDFVVTEYLTMNNADRVIEAGEVLGDVGVDVNLTHKLKAAEYGLLTKVGMTMFLNPEAKKAMADRIKAAAK